MLESLLNRLIKFTLEALTPTLWSEILEGDNDDMMNYRVKLFKEEVPLKQKKKLEEELGDLLKAITLLAPHKMDGEVKKKIRTLRDGRKQKHYTLELTRKFNTYDGLTPKTAPVKYHFPKIAKAKGLTDSFFEIEEVIEQKPITTEIKFSAPLTKEEVIDPVTGIKKRVSVNKTKLLAKLKDQIIAEIQSVRKKQKPVYEDFTFREGLKVPKLGDAYVEPGTFLKLIEKKIRFNMTKGKTPTDSLSNYIGLEIEFLSKEDREFLCDQLYQAGVGKYVHVHSDGSLTKDKDYPNPHEISILVKENELETVIPKLCEVLNTKLHIKVDKSCGLHVHLDMRKRDVNKSFSNLIAMQHFLFAMVPANRLVPGKDKTGYSVPVKDRKFDPRAIADRNAHYDGINQSAYTKYKTLEVRMHCGTSQSTKIVNWVKFLMAIVDAPLIGESPKTLEAARPGVNISNDLLTYCESRMAKFAKEHVKVKKSVPPWMTEVETVMTTPDTISMGEQSEVA